MSGLPFGWLGRSPLRLSKLLREVEQDVETVIRVLQPGPLGVVEHKFSATEINEAKAIVNKSIENWRRNSTLEKPGHLVQSRNK